MAVKFGILVAFRCHFDGHGSGISMAITTAIVIILGFIMTVSITKPYLVHLVHRNASRRAVPFFRHIKRSREHFSPSWRLHRAPSPRAIMMLSRGCVRSTLSLNPSSSAPSSPHNFRSLYPNVFKKQSNSRTISFDVDQQLHCNI
jgi:hypothetical protein